MSSAAHNTMGNGAEPARALPTRPRIVPRLLRTTDAARYLGMGEKAIRHLILVGELPYVQLRPGNSPFLLDVRDLDVFVERHKFRVGKE